MNHFPIKAIAALCAIGLGGCASTTVNTVDRADPIASPNVVQDRRVVTDESLDRRVSILQVAEGEVSGDLLKIQVTVQNNGSSPRNINYMFEWYDANGMQVSGASSGWRSLRLMGKEQKSISGIAPNPNAVDFNLKLSEPTTR